MQLNFAVTSHLFLLSFLAGCSLAVFYTKGKDTDYPRIGRRSFYTSGGGNHYPRIGRRATGPAGVPDVNPRLLLLAESPDGSSASSSASGGSSSSAAYAELSKRGVFTQSQHGYPRVGRRSGGSGEAGTLEMLNARRNKILERLAELKGDGENETDLDGEEVGGFDAAPSGSSSIPLEIMFLAFDSDGDGKLSKEEFASGMHKYRQQNPLC